MKSIRFSESELEFLKNHYELELVEAENYIAEIRNILAKLGVLAKAASAEKPAGRTGKKRGRPKKKETVAEDQGPAPKKAPKKKRRRKAAKKVVKKAEPKKPTPKKAVAKKPAEKKAPEATTETA